jgi:hypothetical protein
MATLPDNAMNPATGYVFTAVVGTARPAIAAGFDYTAPSTWGEALQDATDGPLWKPVGHTSLENGIEFSSDGDDPETLGTWQVSNLRTTNPRRTYSVVINLADFTVETYKLFYGGGQEVTVEGVPSFVIPDNPVAQERALLILAVDGDHLVAQHFRKVSLLGSDSMTYDPAALTEMPVRATILGGQSYGTAAGQGEVTPRIKLTA